MGSEMCIRDRTKVVNYKVNGSGRDTYINYGNGGFYKSDSLHTDESFYQLSKQNSLPIINSKFKLYHTDGTGRDSYIKYIKYFETKRILRRFL